MNVPGNKRVRRVRCELARVVTRLRREAGMSQADFAGRAKLNQGTISLIEAGKREPSLTTFLRLAGGLGVDPAGLLLQVCELAAAGRPMEESWHRDARTAGTGR